MQTTLLALMLLSNPCFAAETTGGSAKKELQMLQGTWKQVYEEDSGQKIPVDPREVITFDGDLMVNRIGEKVTDKFRVFLNPRWTAKEQALRLAWIVGPSVSVLGPLPHIIGGDVAPALINPAMDLLEARAKSDPCPAIYKIEGNKLTICANFTSGGLRPTDLTTSKINRNVLLVWEKLEPKQLP